MTGIAEMIGVIFLAFMSVPWLWLLVAQRSVKRAGKILHAQGVTAPEDQDARVCVVIPARNEADTLKHCVDSVLAGAGGNTAIRIIDDRSTDETYEIASDLARMHPSVSVIRIKSLADGWLGKSHALWFGTRTIDADWILFLDADCLVEPSCVSMAIAEAKRQKASMLSLWPGIRAESFWEHMLIPLCGGIIALWFRSSQESGTRESTPFANGQFLLIRREAYELMDGHRSVRTALIEDIPFAEHAEAMGFPCWVAGGRDLVTVRMYRNLSQISSGWSRIFVGALRSGTKILASVAWLAVGSLLPYVLLPVLVTTVLLRDSGTGTNFMAMVAIFLCILQISLILLTSVRFWSMGGCRRRYLWLYPVSVVAVITLLLQSWWWLIVRRRVGWKRTTYIIDRSAKLVG